jgi:hypothetical protein
MLCIMRHGHHTRRHRFDPLQPSIDPTWLVVRDRHGSVLEVTTLEPHADVRARLTAAREARITAGWDCEPIGPACASFFCS